MNANGAFFTADILGIQDVTHLTGLLQQEAIPLDNDVYPFSLPLPDQLRSRAHTPDTEQHIKHQASI